MPKFNALPLAAHDGDRAGGPAARDPGAHARDARRPPSSASRRTGRTSATAAARRTRRRGVERLGAVSSWTSTPTRPTRASSSRASAPTSSTRRSSSSRRRARSRRCRPARRRSTSPTPSTPTSATAPSAPRSTAGSSRSTTTCRAATASRSSPASRPRRGPSRDWLSLVASSRARNKIRQFFSREQKEDLEAKGRESLENALKAPEPPVQEARRLGRARRRDPRVRLQEGRGLLHRARLREADRVEDRRQGAAAAQGATGRAEEPVAAQEAARARGGRQRHLRDQRRSASRTSSSGSRSAARRCPATTSSATSRSARASRSTATTARTSARCAATPSGSRRSSGREAARRASASRSRVDSWDRPRLLEDVARTFAEHGSNIVSYGGTVEDQMARNWYLAEVGDVQGAARPAHLAAQRRRRLRRPPRHALLAQFPRSRDRGSPTGGYPVRGIRRMVDAALCPSNEGRLVS